MSGSDISEEEHGVTLHAERPVMAKETVTEDHQVSETLRKEQIDGPDTERPGKVDTGNAQHAGMLSKYGIDPSSLGDKLAASARSANQPPGRPRAT
jgi:hypothetical protein